MNYLRTLIITSSVLTLASCGSSKKVATTPVSDAVKVAQDLKAAGYQVTGGMSTFSMESLLQRHNDIVLSDMDRYIPVEGSSEGAGLGDLSSAKLVALNDAALQYATKAGSSVEGGIETAFDNLGPETRRKLVGAYTQKVREMILPSMKESLSVYRIVSKEYQVRTFCIIDEQQAVVSREKAMQESLKDLALDDIAAGVINDLVKKIVKGE